MLSKHREYFFLVAGFWCQWFARFLLTFNFAENRSGNKLVCYSGYNRVGCSGSWPPQSALSQHPAPHTNPPPPPPKRKPGLPDDFCRPSVREYNLRVVPALNLKRTPVGAIFVDPFRGVRGISQQKMKELLSLMIKWEQKALLVFLIWSKFPLVWVIKVPCGNTYNFVTLSGVSFQ